MHKIVYLQTNEKVAKTFQEEFKKEQIEMLIVKSGEEALDVISKEKVLLLLLDINIPDMRFRKLVDKIRNISPQIIINVCIDVLDPMMITKLSNRHRVHKIYMAPWDVGKLIEEVKESIEIAIINEQVNIREDKINSEIDELNNTVESLKNTLKKQQKSYSKFISLTDCFEKAAMDEELNVPGRQEKLEFAKNLNTAMLKMQTTGSFDIDRFEENIRKDLSELKKQMSASFDVGIIESCLFAGQSRAYAQNIRFAIYMIARLYSQFYKHFSLNVSSHFITTKETEFVIEVEHSGDFKYGDSVLFFEYHKFVNELIEQLSTNRRIVTEENVVTYCCNFLVAKDRELLPR